MRQKPHLKKVDMGHGWSVWGAFFSRQHKTPFSLCRDFKRVCAKASRYSKGRS